jgi:hypothetical protein
VIRKPGDLPVADCPLSVREDTVQTEGAILSRDGKCVTS